MRWDSNYTSSEVEDRRGEGPVRGGGGVPVWALLQLTRFGWPGVLIAIAIGGFLLYQGVGGDSERRPATSSPQETELVHFVGFVFDDVQKTWARQIPGFHDAHLVLFRDSTRSGCGIAEEQIGPFYCPRDQKVYIDLEFYRDLREKLGAPGDFAQAYVIAHEVGHHVQRLENILREDGGSVAIELQADCLAGAWAKDAEARGLLEVGDLDEAINAAQQIGDDTLQKKATGRVRPETFTHGSSAQRVGSFRKGYDGGARACGLR
jgi:predicted metalloprotease